jgi:hypothetical protein
MMNEQENNPQPQQHNEGNYIVLNTKVSKDIWQRLQLLLGKKNINVYEMLQMVCDCLVRYMDDRHNLSPELERLMQTFEHMEGWTQAFNIADPTVQRDIGEAIYIMQDREGKKRGVRAFRSVRVTKPIFKERHISFNVQEIVERVIEVCNAPLYRKLRSIAIDKDCNSIMELLITIADEYANESDAAEIRQTFEDANRSEYGRNIAYGQRSKRIRKGNIEAVQGMIKFAPEDEPEDNSDY